MLKIKGYFHEYVMCFQGFDFHHLRFFEDEHGYTYTRMLEMGSKSKFWLAQIIGFGLIWKFWPRSEL